ncbi:MAG: ribonuclease P protein component [Microlunatus sp.]
MVPSNARMRRSIDFRRTVRLGVHAGRRTLVVHALKVAPTCPGEGSQDVVGTPGRDPLVGFVVSKAVGSAVCRNRVRRRLRHLSRPHLAELSAGTLVVVRALPPAASAGPELSTDLAAAWASAIAKLGRR